MVRCRRHCLQRSQFIIGAIADLIAPEGRLATNLLTVYTVHEDARHS